MIRKPPGCGVQRWAYADYTCLRLDPHRQSVPHISWTRHRRRLGDIMADAAWEAGHRAPQAVIAAVLAMRDSD